MEVSFTEHGLERFLERRIGDCSADRVITDFKFEKGITKVERIITHDMKCATKNKDEYNTYYKYYLHRKSQLVMVVSKSDNSIITVNPKLKRFKKCN